MVGYRNVHFKENNQALSDILPYRKHLIKIKGVGENFKK